jgi:predicted NAD/FAD-dependent oxidoreductase
MDGHTDILIIGGGMAGLCAATALAAAGQRIIVLDKGRGPGGRMAARRAELAGESVSFDHGAQYFTARDPAFRAAVAAWEAAGVAARWPAAGDDAWVGTPGMNAPIRAMAQPLDVRWGVRADALSRTAAGWRVAAGEQGFTAPTVLVAVPAEQAAVLLADAAPDLAALAGGVESAPCWAVMAGFAAPLPIAHDTFRSDHAPISWAARNSAKPGRSGAETWVIHASQTRSRALINLPKDVVAAALLDDFFAGTGILRSRRILMRTAGCMRCRRRSGARVRGSIRLWGWESRAITSTARAWKARGFQAGRWPQWWFRIGSPARRNDARARIWRNG